MGDALQQVVRFLPLLSLVLASLVLASPCRAADAVLDAFVAEVLARSPSLAASAHRRDAFRSEASATDMWPDPQISVMVDNVPGHDGGEMPMLRYQLEQMIPWPGKLGLMRDAIERQGDAAGAELESRRLDLVFEAKQAFLMLAMNRRALAVNAASLEVVGVVVRAALGRYAAAVAGHHEVARAQVEQSALEVERLNLEGDRTAIVAMMNALRNRPSGARVPETDPVETPAGAPSVDRLVALALAKRPELARMRAMQREAIAMGELAERETYPDLVAGVWYNHMLGEPDSAGAMIGATIPLFGVTRQDRRAAASRGRASAAAHDVAAMQAMIRFEIADALRRLDTATRQLALLRTVAVPGVRQSFEAALAAYGTGGPDVIGVLDARRSLQSMELGLARAQIDREVAIARLERAVGLRWKEIAP